MTRFSRPAAFVFTVALSAQTATAEQVINDSVSIDGALCVGPSCEPGDSPAFGIRLKSYAPDIEFYDVDIPGNAVIGNGHADIYRAAAQVLKSRALYKGVARSLAKLHSVGAQLAEGAITEADMPGKTQFDGLAGVHCRLWFSISGQKISGPIRI